MFHGGPDGDAAYECFVDSASSFSKHGDVNSCPFLDSANNDAWVKDNQFDYTLEKGDLLASDMLHQDFFLVIDNSGWYSAVTGQTLSPSDDSDSTTPTDDVITPDVPTNITNTTNSTESVTRLRFNSAKTKLRAGDQTNDVVLDIELVTEYKDNDVFNFMFVGGLAVVGIMVFLLVVLLIAYKCSRSTYNKLVEEQMEYKQEQLMQNGYMEEEDYGINTVSQDEF